MSDAIPREVALQLCDEIRREKEHKWFSQCWGCVKASKGGFARMCVSSRPDYRGCNLVSERYEVKPASRRMRLISRGMSVTQGHVRVPLSGKRIQTLYDSMSSIYDLLTRYERGSLKKALEIANPRENLLILEAGFGTGRTLVELARKVGDTGEVYALDVSRTMTNRTHRILHRCNLSHRVNLVIGDARHTPFCDTVFDLVFSSYMLDLIDSDAIPRVLSEFKRLLKSTGSLVLVGLSKGSKWYDNMKLYEWAYRRSSLLFGACRPVLLVPYLQELGFKNVNRKYMRAGHLMPTEIVWANKDK